MSRLDLLIARFVKTDKGPALAHRETQKLATSLAIVALICASIHQYLQLQIPLVPN